MKIGELWLIEIPSSYGHEQSGLRPALIMSNEEAETIIIIPFTTNLKSLKYVNTITIEPSKANGLEKTSVALIFQLRAIDINKIVKRIGILEKHIFEDIVGMVCKKLNLA